MVKEVAMVMDAKKPGKPSLRCLPAVYPRFATNPKTKIVTAKTLNGTVLFDTIEMKTLKELFSSSYKSENCRKP